MKSTIKLLLAICFCTNISAIAVAQTSQNPQNISVGLRLGDPTGITIKKYFASTKALEFNIGRTSFWNNNIGNNKYFDRWYDDKYIKGDRGDFNKNFKGWRDNYRFNAFSFQAHYLIHRDIKGVPGFRWYFGFGPQVRIFQYKYQYYNEFNRYLDESHVFVHFGADATGGVEYTFAAVPLSVFADVNIYLEVFPSPFYVQGQGGIGCRYNF